MEEQKRKMSRRRKRKRLHASETTSKSGPICEEELEPTSFIVVRVTEPIIGVSIKYRTDRAAEVGRIIGIQGRLAAAMLGCEQNPGVSDLAPISVPNVSEKSGSTKENLGQTKVIAAVPSKPKENSENGSKADEHKAQKKERTTKSVSSNAKRKNTKSKRGGRR